MGQFAMIASEQALCHISPYVMQGQLHPPCSQWVN